MNEKSLIQEGMTSETNRIGISLFLSMGWFCLAFLVVLLFFASSGALAAEAEDCSFRVFEQEPLYYVMRVKQGKRSGESFWHCENTQFPHSPMFLCREFRTDLKTRYGREVRVYSADPGRSAQTLCRDVLE